MEISADGRKRKISFDGLTIRREAVRTSSAARFGTIPERLVDDGLDRAGAATTLGAATETTVDLLGIAEELLRALDGTSDVVVGKHVAGTDDHL